MMHTRCRFASLAAATMVLAAPGPASSHDDGDNAFCVMLTHRAVRINADAGRWLDRVTRHDGMVVECDGKRIEFRRFISVEPSVLGEDWEEHKEREWKIAHCRNPQSRAAMQKGWTIRAAYTTVTGEKVSITAEDCD
jgi:hypothetical protein